MTFKKIKVLVVDDSALVRQLLAKIIDSQSDMECVAAANDPLVARDLIRFHDPDVITLDVEMPKMDGIDFLARLMRLRPTPVIMISTLTERGADVTLKALELGAIDFVAKPRVGISDGLQELSNQIVEKIRVAAIARIRRSVLIPPVERRLDHTAQSFTPSGESRRAHIGRISTEKVIFIGASTGGTEAIKEILTKLPSDSPAIVITQHMPAGFTTSFAKRLDSLCEVSVKEAEDGERLLPGHAYIAPGGAQFSVGRSGANYIAVVDDGPPVNRHKPSVEILFQSGAEFVGANALGVMLTGMGADGAFAMRQMKDAGSYNFVQNESTCVVFGMPREAIAHGAADEILALGDIAGAIIARLSGSSDSPRHRI